MLTIANAKRQGRPPGHDGSREQISFFTTSPASRVRFRGPRGPGQCWSSVSGWLCRFRQEWLTYLDHPGFSPTNNLAELALRAVVIFRKLTFGSRTRAGAKRLGTMMTVIETAKRQGRSVLKFLRALLRRRPPGRTHWRYQDLARGGAGPMAPLAPRAILVLV